jgi:hypothetical protein
MFLSFSHGCVYKEGQSEAFEGCIGSGERVLN